MISVIVCSADAEKTAHVHAHYERLLGTVPNERLLIYNPESMAAGYNQAIDKSRGDVLIFSHDDVEFLQDDFVGTIERHLQSVDVLGVAGTDLLTGANWISAGGGHLFGQVAHPHSRGFGVCEYGTESVLATDCMALDGCWMCAKREVVESIRFDDATFDGFHCYDLDFSFRAHLARYRVGVASDLFPIHYSGGTYNERWRESCRKFEQKHADNLGLLNWKARPFTSRHARDKVEVLRMMQENLAHEPAHN